MSKVSIAGLNKVELLRKLWSGQKPALFFEDYPSLIPRFDEVEAREAVKGYIDYFQGRCIKTDISGDTASPHLYDRETGRGAFAKAVAAVHTKVTK
jgi:hypothetical protein